MDTMEANPQQIALAAAIEHIGGYSAAARALKMKTAWGVQKWKRCPAERVRALVTATGNKVTAHELRPDIYPDGFVFPADAAQPEHVASTQLNTLEKRSAIDS